MPNFTQGTTANNLTATGTTAPDTCNFEIRGPDSSAFVYCQPNPGATENGWKMDVTGGSQYDPIAIDVPADAGLGQYQARWWDFNVYETLSAYFDVVASGGGGRTPGRMVAAFLRGGI
jgi:hypothetical protein